MGSSLKTQSKARFSPGSVLNPHFSFFFSPSFIWLQHFSKSWIPVGLPHSSPWHISGEKSLFFPSSRIIEAWGQPHASPKPSTCSVFPSRLKWLFLNCRAPHAPPQTFPISCYSGFSCPSFCQAKSLPGATLKFSSPILPLSNQPNLLHLLCSSHQRPSTWFLIYCHLSLLNSTGRSTWASVLQCSFHCSIQLLSGVLTTVAHSSFTSAPFSTVPDFLSW